MDISTVALLLSAFSLCLSLYVIRRDKGLSASINTYVDANELLGYKIGIYIVNIGKDPRTVRKLVLTSDDGEKFEHVIRNDKGGLLKLAQSDFYEHLLDQRNSSIIEWAKSKLKHVEIQDSYGDSFEVKDFANAINQRHHPD